jgi:hypothetical protein
MHVEFVRADDGKVRDEFTVFARDAAGCRKPLLANATQNQSSADEASAMHDQGIADECYSEDPKVIDFLASSGHAPSGHAPAIAPEVPEGLCPTKSDGASDASD